LLPTTVPEVVRAVFALRWRLAAAGAQSVARRLKAARAFLREARGEVVGELYTARARAGGGIERTQR